MFDAAQAKGISLGRGWKGHYLPVHILELFYISPSFSFFRGLGQEKEERRILRLLLLELLFCPRMP